MPAAARRTAVLAALLLTTAAGADDPNWPCQQIKVNELSLASVWSGPPVDPHDTAWKEDQEVADLVQALVPRREPIDRAQTLIHDFAQHAGNQKQTKLLDVLVGLFNAFSVERASILTGLDRFGRRQKQLAAQIRADNEKLRALQSNPAADAQAVQELTRQVTWEVEVFQDRRQALRYACEAPGKIEQRLFALARQLQHEME